MSESVDSVMPYLLYHLFPQVHTLNKVIYTCTVHFAEKYMVYAVVFCALFTIMTGLS